MDTAFTEKGKKMGKCKDCLHYEVCADIAEKSIICFTEQTTVDKICANFKEHTEYVKKAYRTWKIIPSHGELHVLAVRSCSRCLDVYPIFKQELNYNYCPNCGADMRERKENGQA